MIAKAALATTMVFLPISAALAFGQEGHSIIGEIANRRLTAHALTAVENAIGKGLSLAAVGVGQMTREMHARRPITGTLSTFRSPPTHTT